MISPIVMMLLLVGADAEEKEAKLPPIKLYPFDTNATCCAGCVCPECKGKRA